MSAIDVRSASIDLGSWNLLVVLSLLFAAMDSMSQPKQRELPRSMTAELPNPCQGRDRRHEDV